MGDSDRVGWAFTFAAATNNLVLPRSWRPGQTASAGCQLIGHWRIMEAVLGGARPSRPRRPAIITIGTDNHGQVSFGTCKPASISAKTSMVFFAGCDEMYEVTGAGYTELLDEGSTEIKLAHDNGDQAPSRQTRSFFNRWGDWDRPRAEMTAARRQNAGRCDPSGTAKSVNTFST
ncbi:hypothetical protein NKI86_31000 [Mesorhizobium sp. M0320]|uniref:hypothetical protein n=1 Tax=Mesorhizobium sp. M0320 TaxID=2956936 RepID=UPI00333BF2DE